VYFGPLVYARHACKTHANNIPDSQPDSDRTRYIVSGLSTSNYAGAYTISFNRIEAGEDLAFRSSESYAAPDDNFGLCVICARARDTACEDVELKDEEVDMSIVPTPNLPLFLAKQVPKKRKGKKWGRTRNPQSLKASKRSFTKHRLWADAREQLIYLTADDPDI
jgi:hypothetical protein